jgi:hypothetical protein
MVDGSLTGGTQPSSVCPWCSATYDGAPENCPSCGATLAGDSAGDAALPGLTAIDAAAIVRSKEPVKRSRSRLLSWISGEYPDETPSASEAGALAPPDAEVRREILRLELEAEVASLQAEADALRAEATVEGQSISASPEDAAAAAAVIEEIDAVSADLDELDETLDTAPLVPEDAVADADRAADGAAKPA